MLKDVKSSSCLSFQNKHTASAEKYQAGDELKKHSSVFNLIQSRPTHANVLCPQIHLPLHKSLVFSFVVTGKKLQ